MGTGALPRTSQSISEDPTGLPGEGVCRSLMHREAEPACRSGSNPLYHCR